MDGENDGQPNPEMEKAKKSVSADFVASFDALVKEAEALQGVPEGDVVEVRTFRKHDKSKRKQHVNDEAEILAADTRGEIANIMASVGATIDGMEQVEIEKLKEAHDGAKRSNHLRAISVRRNKYIFRDAFGSPAGVMLDDDAKKALLGLLDIQINCIVEVAKLSGKFFDVWACDKCHAGGVPWSKRLIGQVYCVGFGNAISLSSQLCEEMGVHLLYVCISKTGAS